MTDQGSSVGAYSLYAEKEIHPLCRSNHTMCTVVSKKKTTSNGVTVTDFTSYIFGGLVPNVYNQLVCTNDLIIVKSRQVTDKEKGFVAHEGSDYTTTEGVDEASYQFVYPKKPSDIVPLERRDHSAALMQSNSLLLIYGGRNDNTQSSQFRELSDLIVFDLKKQ